MRASKVGALFNAERTNRNAQLEDPLHGVTLEALLNALVARYGWAEMARQVNINCFKSDPSIKSSLKFLRRTPWARKEVEAMYLASLDDDAPVEKADPWANWQKK